MIATFKWLTFCVGFSHYLCDGLGSSQFLHAWAWRFHWVFNARVFIYRSFNVHQPRVSGCASVKDNHGMAFGLLYFTVVIFDLVNDGHNLEIINRNLEYVRNLEYMIKLIIKENEKCNRWIGDNIVSSFKAIQKVIRNQFVF